VIGAQLSRDFREQRLRDVVRRPARHGDFEQPLHKAQGAHVGGIIGVLQKRAFEGAKPLRCHVVSLIRCIYLIDTVYRH
jgi:hypothetical protein